MTLNEAFEQFTGSDEFKQVQKLNTPEGGRYRTLLSRFRKGKLGIGVIVEVIEANGYEVKANKVTKKK